MQWFNTGHKKNDTKDSTASFVHSRTRENIKSGEKHSTIFGKIARYLQDLKLVAFTGSYDDLTGKPTAMTPTVHTHTKSQISDFPSSLPASDVPAWAKAATKPSYTWAEIGNKPDIFNLTYIYYNGWYHVNVPEANYDYSFKPFIKFANDTVNIGYVDKNNKTDNNSENNVFVFKTSVNPNASFRSFYPNFKNILLGTPTYKWSDIYCYNSTISTSDKNQKKDISYIGQDSNYDNTRMDDDTLVKLILGIKPVIYTRIDGDSNRPHHGLLANDFELLLKKLGIKDHAGFIKSPKQVQKETVDEKGNTTLSLETIENEYVYGFRYEELITDIIRFCQIQDDKVKKQEEKINQQQEEINSLEARLEMLEAKIK